VDDLAVFTESHVGGQFERDLHANSCEQARRIGNCIGRALVFLPDAENRRDQVRAVLDDRYGESAQRVRKRYTGGLARPKTPVGGGGNATSEQCQDLARSCLNSRRRGVAGASDDRARLGEDRAQGSRKDQKGSDFHVYLSGASAGLMMR